MICSVLEEVVFRCLNRMVADLVLYEIYLLPDLKFCLPIISNSEMIPDLSAFSRVSPILCSCVDVVCHC